MKKSERREPQGEDRLSELPDSVIFHIFRSVPMIDVVRTTILSKRWKNLWTTLPFLNFDGNSPWIRKRGFRRSVNQFLFRWNGVRILELRLSFCFEDLISSEIESWVQFAVEKGVEGLYLHDNLSHTLYDDLADRVCLLPQCLYLCSSLKVLSIQNCKFTIDGCVQWNKLKNLKIWQDFEMSEHVINQILCGSPMLEVFELSFLDKGKNLNIRSHSLKELTIHKFLYNWDDDDFEYASSSELSIWTPNLVTLNIRGIPFGKWRLIGVPSSTHVTIGLFGLFSYDGDYGIPPSYYIDFIGDKFDQILQLIKHVESIELICSCRQVLGAVDQRCTYLNVKSLVVRDQSYGCIEFICLLKLFPRLSRLVLEWDNEEFNDCTSPSFEAHVPKSFWLQLRTVDITWYKGGDIFPFIEFLLKYADKLEKMVFRVVETLPPSNSLLLASHELLKMPRSSPSCIILIKPNQSSY